jgi:CheY-like chemotaxis protein
VSYTAFRDSERKIKGVLVFVEDVTAQYLARSKVQELAEEAQLASQAKSQFLANMSHEIRTPMNAILGFSELLRDPDVTAQEHDEFVRRIRANGDHLLALIDDILDLSRVEAGKMSFENVDFSIVDMVSELNASFSVLAKGRTVQTRLELTNAIPSRVKSDPTRVRQIIMNMVSNAVKFTDSGSVDIRVTYVTSPASAVCITVRDTGIGIPENAQAELFKPFRQADNSITRRFGGTGLGLSLSRRIAEALGGSLILVKSKLGEGSTFQFTLPIGDVSDDELISAVTPASPTSSYDFYSGVLSGLTLLLAEDSPDNRAVLQAFLRKTEAKLIFAEDGIEAVRRAKNEKFDLILMDIQMPELDGLSATRELRRAGLAVPIVALTAHALPEEIKRSHEAGCNGHLTKPINRDELVSAILRFAKHLA